MNFLQELENAYGNQVNDGLSTQTELNAKALDKAKPMVLAASLAGLIRKVSTERGTDYLYKLLEDYDDTIIDKFGKATDAEYSKWQADGEQLMPVLLISSIVKENIINHISRVIKQNYQSTKKIFALLVPVLLSYISKQLKEKNYSKKDLVKALRSQKYNVKKQVDDDISRELGMGTWHLGKTVEDEIEEEALEPIEIIEEEEIISQTAERQMKTKQKSGMPGWLWPVMLLGVLAMLIVGLQLGFDNESTSTKISEAKPGDKTIADNSINTKPVDKTNIDNSIDKKNIEEEPVNSDKNSTKDYFDKDYFAESQKNNPDNENFNDTTITEEKKEEEQVAGDTVPEKIEKKIAEAPPSEIKENVAQPILPKDEPAIEEEKKPETEVKEPQEFKEEEKPEEILDEEKEPEKPKKKSYKGPLSLLNMVANRTTASVIDFGKITSSSNELTSKGKNMLNDVAEIMQANPNLNITIRGHHKKYANDNDNYTANSSSEAKAYAAYNYLINKGINASRIKSESVSFNEPVNARDPGNDKNDRISIKTK